MFPAFPGSPRGLIITLALWLAPAQTPPKEPIELKARFSPDHAVYVEVTREIDRIVTGDRIPGKRVQSKIKRITGVIERLESRTTRAASLVLTFDRAAMDYFGGFTQQFIFDSDYPARKGSMSLRRILSLMLGQSIRMDLDRNHAVTYLEGMAPIWQTVSEKAAGNPLLSLFEGSFDDDTARRTWGDERFAMLPGTKVRVGDTWKRTLEEELPQLGVLAIQFNCRFDRIADIRGRRAAVITYDGAIFTRSEAIPRPGSTEPQGRVEKGSLKGTTVFDIDRGMILRQDQERRMTFSMTAPADQGGYPMKVETTRLETVITQNLEERERDKKERRAKSGQSRKINQFAPGNRD